MFIPALSASAAAVFCPTNVQWQIRFLVAVYATAVVIQSARQGSALWGIADGQGRAHLSRYVYLMSALGCGASFGLFSRAAETETAFLSCLLFLSPFSAAKSSVGSFPMSRVTRCRHNSFLLFREMAWHFCRHIFLTLTRQQPMMSTM